MSGCPIGVWIGLRPRVARIVAADGAVPGGVSRPICCFPIAVSAIVPIGSNPDIWLSPLMILGTQWYILFNVIAGARRFPSDLRDVGDQSAPARLAVVAQGRAARRSSPST